MNYNKYLASSAWKKKRKERLEIDGHRCVVCKTSERLSVHHLTYDRLGDEDVHHDLVSVCTPCHRLFDNLERYARYEKRPTKVTVISNETIRKGLRNVTNNAVQINLELPNDYAQRPKRESVELLREEIETSIIQEAEDRSRSSRNG